MSLKEHREKLKSIPYVPISWRPKYFRYNGTEQSITAAAGVGPMVDLFFEDPLFQDFRQCLPLRVSPASYHSELFAMTTICSGICGHDSIDDILEFHDDPGIREKLGGEIPAPKTMGDYYRSFQPHQVQDLNEFLRKQSRRYREQVIPNKSLIIDMDSTSHIQRGLKMEGVEWNYIAPGKVWAEGNEDEHSMKFCNRSQLEQVQPDQNLASRSVVSLAG